MQRRDMMGTGFLLQLFLQAQGVFKAKCDFHCQKKLLLSDCSLLFDRGSEGGLGGTNCLPPALVVFLKNVGKMFLRNMGRIWWDTLRDPSAENPGCVALTTEE